MYPAFTIPLPLQLNWSAVAPRLYFGPFSLQIHSWATRRGNELPFSRANQLGSLWHFLVDIRQAEFILHACLFVAFLEQDQP